jgi:hypothetical protein
MGYADQRNPDQRCGFDSIEVLFRQPYSGRKRYSSPHFDVRWGSVKHTETMSSKAEESEAIHGLFFQADKIPDPIGKRCILKFGHRRTIRVIQLVNPGHVFG